MDDIHIFDNTYGIYTGPPSTAQPSHRRGNGSSWVDFTGGKLIASVNPNGQNLGNADARPISIPELCVMWGQYYRDRNITIKPANRNPVRFRLGTVLLLDTETETLINATGCPRLHQAFDGL